MVAIQIVAGKPANPEVSVSHELSAGIPVLSKPLIGLFCRQGIQLLATVRAAEWGVTTLWPGETLINYR